MKRAMLPVGVILPLSIACLFLGLLPQQLAGNPEILEDEPTPTPASAPGPGGIRLNGLACSDTTWLDDTLATPACLEMQLSDATEGPLAAPKPRMPSAEGRDLTPDELAHILSLLPPFTQAERETTFALPPRTLPPPLTGAVIRDVFPALDSAPLPPAVPVGKVAEEAESLFVQSFAPEGDIGLAAQVIITFSQPMIAIGALTSGVPASVPALLTPSVPGEWRWMDARTLLFEARPRFPMATEYTVRIPAGTRAVGAAALARDCTWTFRTSTPRLVDFRPPYGPQGLTPVIYAEFDQRVDTPGLRPAIRLYDADARRALRPATAAEITADANIAHLAEAAREGYWIALRAVETLRANRAYRVVFGPNLASAEGPRLSPDAEERSFATYGPLRLVRPPTRHSGSFLDSHLLFEFNNPLVEDLSWPDLVAVTPPIENLRLTAHGAALHVDGRLRPRTLYKFQFSGAIRDVFGQKLGKVVSVTLETGIPRPQLASGTREFNVLDPASPQALAISSIGCPALRVRLRRVTPDDWAPYELYPFLREEAPPGRLVSDDTLQVPGGGLVPTTTLIDLAAVLHGKPGQVLVCVDPVPLPERDWPRGFRTWLLSTRIGLLAFADQGEILVWATDLASGAPLAGVTVHVRGTESTAMTDARGIARLPFPPRERSREVLVAQLGSDRAILPPREWRERHRRGDFLWYTVDDRNLYRPGETVHLKGWVRRWTGGPAGDIGSVGGLVADVAYTVRDSRGNEIAQGMAPIDDFGGFHCAFPVPADASLGHADLDFCLRYANGERIASGTHSDHFTIQEFRRPEFEVTTHATEGTLRVGGEAVVTATGTFYTGAPLSSAKISWRVRATPGSYRPPNWPGFFFGGSSAEWERIVYTGSHPTPSDCEQTLTAITNGRGEHALSLRFTDGPPFPMSILAEARLQDLNRQSWSHKSVLLVHPSALCVGLRTDRNYVPKGKPIRVEVIVTDLDGTPVPNREVRFVAERREWRWVKRDGRDTVARRYACRLASGDTPQVCEFMPDAGGSWRLTATVTDIDGRRHRTTLTRWVAGAPDRTPQRSLEAQSITLVPERDTWAPGDTARFLIPTPFQPAEALVRICHDGIIDLRQLRIDGPSATVAVPIREQDVPGLHVSVELVGAAPRVNDEGIADSTLPRRPAMASGSLTLRVPPASRTLSVDVAPEADVLAPGQTTRVRVEVRDADGRPVDDAQVLLVVVDEAVLALTNYRLPDVVGALCLYAGYCSPGLDLRRYVLLMRPGLLGPEIDSGELHIRGGRSGEEMVALSADVIATADELRIVSTSTRHVEALDVLSSGEESGEVFHLRSDFDPLACFAPQVETGRDGGAWVEVSLPDNLTRYRVTAVAVDRGKRAGQGEATITARLPLMARPSLPRFLRSGDACELPVVIQNQSAGALEVDVAVRVANLTLTATAGRHVRVPALESREVRFPATTVRPGTARVQVGARAGGWTDAIEVATPVWTPATTEAFATYGTLDEGAVAQSVVPPADVFPEYGALSVSTSATALQALTDAVIYLREYPYQCAEQRASRLLGTLAVRDVLEAFQGAGLPDSAYLAAVLAREVEGLAALQGRDGGFALWRRNGEVWPYASIHVTHALVRAAQAGLMEDRNRTLRDALRYIREITRNIADWYAPPCRRSLIAYALYVRHVADDSDPKTAVKLLAEAGSFDNLQPEALGWLLPVLSSGNQEAQALRDEILRWIRNRVSETASTAQFTTRYVDGEHLMFHSSRRTDAVMLEGLISTQPENELIPKLARGLLAQRRQGRWSTTQENCWALIALNHYFRTYEKATPDFLARIWLGDRLAAEQRYRGRTTERHELQIPLHHVTDVGPSMLTLAKDGPGRLYYRIGMECALRDITPPAVDRGFVVGRAYEGADDSTDVWRDAEERWHIRAGARVRVRLTMFVPERRYHVALVDRLPAGLEALNPELAGTGDLPVDRRDGRRPSADRCWWRYWFEHQNLRDDRAEVFRSMVWPGSYGYSYFARATTPGTFSAPPPTAEEMYQPETYGRGEGATVIVEAD